MKQSSEGNPWKKKFCGRGGGGEECNIHRKKNTCEEMVFCKVAALEKKLHRKYSVANFLKFLFDQFEIMSFWR